MGHGAALVRTGGRGDGRRLGRLGVGLRPGDDQDRPSGHVQQPPGHAAQQKTGQVGAAARAEHDQARVVVLGRVQDSPGDVTEIGLADLAFRADARRPQVGHDLLHDAFALSFAAVHLDASVAAGRELVHVQDDDVVAAVTAEVARHVRGGPDVAGGVV